MATENTESDFNNLLLLQPVNSDHKGYNKRVRIGKVNPEIWGSVITPKLRQKDLRDQHNQLCVTTSAVAIANLDGSLIKCKSNKNLTGKEYRETCLTWIGLTNHLDIKPTDSFQEVHGFGFSSI